MNRPSVNEYFPSSKEGIAFVKTAFPATEATNSQRMKSISFSEELEFTQETLGLDDYNEEEISDVWYSREDYLAFKLDARRQAKVIRVSYAKFVASIEQAYSFCDDVANEMGEEAAMEMTLKRIGLTQQWCMQPDFRGLERWSSMTLRQHCENSRDDAAHIAVVSQFLCPTEVRRRYQDTSRATRLFARMIAEPPMPRTPWADSLLLKGNEEDNHLVNKVLKVMPQRGRHDGAPLKYSSVQKGDTPPPFEQDPKVLFLSIFH